MTAEFGTTAWGHGWRRLAEPLAVTRPDPALPRARSLVRGDQVVHYDAGPGRVDAEVGDPRPHRVRLTFEPWTPEELAVVAPLLAGRAETDDLPDDTHEALRALGLAIAPVAPETSCSCPGRRRPCVHVLAVFLETARRADERPMLALRLRGAVPTVSAAGTARIPLSALDPAGFFG